VGAARDTDADGGGAMACELRGPGSRTTRPRSSERGTGIADRIEVDRRGRNTGEHSHGIHGSDGHGAGDRCCRQWHQRRGRSDVDGDAPSRCDTRGRRSSNASERSRQSVDCRFGRGHRRGRDRRRPRFEHASALIGASPSTCRRLSRRANPRPSGTNWHRSRTLDHTVPRSAHLKTPPQESS
jgi:hypothetical protein